MCRDIDYVRTYLKEHGREIGGRAEKGDVLSAQIISAYDLLVDRPTDPGPKGLLMGMIHDYKKRAVGEGQSGIQCDAARKDNISQSPLG